MNVIKNGIISTLPSIISRIKIHFKSNGRETLVTPTLSPTVPKAAVNSNTESIKGKP
jgi:hypothetical protein